MNNQATVRSGMPVDVFKMDHSLQGSVMGWVYPLLGHAPDQGWALRGATEEKEQAVKGVCL